MWSDQASKNVRSVYTQCYTRYPMNNIITFDVMIAIASATSSNGIFFICILRRWKKGRKKKHLPFPATTQNYVRNVNSCIRDERAQEYKSTHHSTPQHSYILIYICTFTVYNTPYSRSPANSMFIAVHLFFLSLVLLRILCCWCYHDQFSLLAVRPFDAIAQYQ